LTGTNAKIKAAFDATYAADPTTPVPYYYPAVDYRDINVKFTSKNQSTTTSSFFNNYTTSVVRELLTSTHDFQVGKLSTTVNGVAYYDATVTGKGYQVLAAGATVKLFTRTSTSNSGAGLSRRLIDTVTTGANGLFTFTKVQSGTGVDFEVTTADGKYSGSLTGKTTPNTDGGYLNINQVGTSTGVTVATGIPVTLLNTQIPIIISATPESGSDLDPTTPAVVVFTFSEPIAASVYADATTASTTAGLFNDVAVNYNGAKASNVAHSLAWNTARTALTVTIPVLGASSKYSVDLAAVTGKLKDADGFAIGAATALWKVDFTTFGGVTAAAPSVAIANSASLDYNSNPQLDWLPTSGAKYYAVYRSLVQNWGTTTVDHPYQLLGTTYDSAYTDATVPDIAAGANYPAAQNKKFVENGSVKLTYKYQVKAVNSDNIEGAASTAVTAVDTVGPNLTNSGAFIGDISDGGSTITLYFTEPLNKQAAQTVANYTLSGISPALTITNAVYNGWDNVNTRSSVTLTLSDVLNPANITRTYISSGTDGILSSTVVAGDGAFLPPNSGGLCVSPVGTADASGTVLSSAAVGDDVIFKPANAATASASSIYAGPDGICNSTAAVGDTQTTPVGSKPAANGIGISAATFTNGAINSAAADFTLASTLNNIAPAVGTADDVIVRAILVTVNAGLTDVAGNTIKLTTTSATTAGNRINSDATFTLP
jgi:hypothetical protein